MGLLIASKSILGQLKSLTEQLSTEDYTQTLEVFSGATIGQHTRHILEFYQCVLNDTNIAIINYDNRKRNLLIETDRTYTIDIIDGLFTILERGITDKNVIVEGELGGVKNKLSSSLMRELLYAIEHAVHHMAILKIGVITNFTQVQLNKNFGIAESTVKFQESKQAS